MILKRIIVDLTYLFLFFTEFIPVIFRQHLMRKHFVPIIAFCTEDIILLFGLVLGYDLVTF
jgi:hypothetical protein